MASDEEMILAIWRDLTVLQKSDVLGYASEMRRHTQDATLSPADSEMTSPAAQPSEPVESVPPVSGVCCPKCKSDQITANKKGFGLGKAAAGGLLLGPVGLLGGLVGSRKVTITCLACGNSWQAGGK